MTKGIFWIINGELIYERISCDENGVPLKSLEGDVVAKSGSTYNHKRLWLTLPKSITGGKDYRYYPRGRVEIANGKAKIYLNPIILNNEVKKELIGIFELYGMSLRMIADGSAHYKCHLDDENNKKE